jgi:hypothetical protein
MKALEIVDFLDEMLDVLQCILDIQILIQVDLFNLQGFKEALHEGVVVRIPRSGHNKKYFVMNNYPFMLIVDVKITKNLLYSIYRNI